MKGVIAVLVVVSACNFELPPPDEGATPIVDDSFEDFSSGTTLIDSAVTADGLIEPAAIVVDGLHGRAIADNIIEAGDDYDAVVAKLGSGAIVAGESYRQVPTDWGLLRPRGMGFEKGDNFTLLFEGEIRLPAGRVTLQSAAGDDHVIIELALDGKNFDRVGSAKNDPVSIDLDVTATVGTDAWIPIHIAFEEELLGAKLLLTAQPQGGAPIVIDASRLRARVTEATGLIAFAFKDRAFNSALGETAVSTIDEARPSGFEYDLGPPEAPSILGDLFSVRYVGQLRIDKPGEYTFSCDIGNDVTDGFRLWIDNELVAGRWHNTAKPLTAMRQLEPGWHDLLLDYSQNTGNAQVRLSMSGPDINEVPIASGRLRPVIVRGLTATTYDPLNADIDGTITLSLMLDGTEDMQIGAADYSFMANPTSGVTAELLDCMSPGRRLMDPPVEGTTFYYSADLRCRNTPVKPPTPWRLKLNTTAPRSVSNVGLTVTFHGGPRTPFATPYGYVSSVKSVPGAQRLTSLAVESKPAELEVRYAVRTADDAEALNAAPWIEIPDPKAPDPAIELGELLQYRILVVTDGWQAPVIEKVTVGYTISGS